MDATETAGRGGGVDPLRAALWALFAALVVTGGWLALSACALDALGLDFCPVPVDHAALRREVAAGLDLTRQVHEVQLAIAEKPLCNAPPVQPSFPQPAPAAAPAPAPAARTPDSAAIDRTVTERGGQNGKLQFTLQWASRDDLDLNVACPGGVIESRNNHAGPGICGDGRKDVDANRNLTENVSDTPVENVVWQNDIPTGTYRAVVIIYRSVRPGALTLPFTLRMRLGDKERSCQGTVTQFAESARIKEGSETVSGTGQAISWTTGSELPECRFEPLKLVLTQSGK